MDDLTKYLEHLAQGLEPHFHAGFLQQDNVTFQFTFDAGESYHLTVTDRQFQFSPGEHSHPAINLYLDNHDTASQLLSGSMDGMSAFMQGKYRSDGNIVLSQLLLHLFKSDDRTSIYDVQD